MIENISNLRPAPVLAIVIPCYNEQEALPISLPVLLGLLDEMTASELISPQSYILCSNDGSKDKTWQLLHQYHQTDKRVRAISLAHNRGHQYVLLAGLMEVRGKCDAAISIDADLQDDPRAIADMVTEFNKGKEMSTECVLPGRPTLRSSAPRPTPSTHSSGPWGLRPYMTTPTTAL